MEGFFPSFLFGVGGNIPNVLSLHIDLYERIPARCRFHPSADGWANSQQSPLHASPSLIVNSVNEVNLINFRAGSHMTFSSIFSPTSKTSISSSKMERSDWQSPITPTYLKPRVNLFSSFECVHYNCVFKEDLEIAKKLKLSPRNVQKLFFPPLPLFFNPMSIAQPQWMTQSIVVLHFLFLIRTDHNSYSVNLAVTRKNHFKKESNIALKRGDKVASRWPAILTKIPAADKCAIYFYPVRGAIIRLKK